MLFSPIIITVSESHSRVQCVRQSYLSLGSYASSVIQSGNWKLRNHMRKSGVIGLQQSEFQFLSRILKKFQEEEIDKTKAC